jgi:enoyl-CoA hydratase
MAERTPRVESGLGGDDRVISLDARKRSVGSERSLLKAKQYLLTGDRMPAREALAIGMANFVVPAAELMEGATAFARRLASLPPQAVQDTKLVLNQILRERAASLLPFGLAAESQSSDTVEYAEAPAKFEAQRAERRASRGNGTGS